jgi:hypothetical protein
MQVASLTDHVRKRQRRVLFDCIFSIGARPEHDPSPATTPVGSAAPLLETEKAVTHSAHARTHHNVHIIVKLATALCPI